MSVSDEINAMAQAVAAQRREDTEAARIRREKAIAEYAAHREALLRLCDQFYRWTQRLPRTSRKSIGRGRWTLVTNHWSNDYKSGTESLVVTRTGRLLLNGEEDMEGHHHKFNIEDVKRGIAKYVVLAGVPFD
jgi:hypothetical protein